MLDISCCCRRVKSLSAHITRPQSRNNVHSTWGKIDFKNSFPICPIYHNFNPLSWQRMLAVLNVHQFSATKKKKTPQRINQQVQNFLPKLAYRSGRQLLGKTSFSHLVEEVPGCVGMPPEVISPRVRWPLRSVTKWGQGWHSTPSPKDKTPKSV